MQADPAQGLVAADAPERRPRYGLEIVVVLGVSYGMSGLYALLSYIRTETRGGFRGTTASLNQVAVPDRLWLDFLYQLAGILNGLAPAGLALYLLNQHARQRGFGIGLDLRNWRRDLPQGVGLATIIGVPGIGLYLLARQLGINATIATTTLPDVWYRYPVLLLSAFQNAAGEEIIVLAFVMTRLRQLGWTDSRAIGLSALIRGSYHLYQGVGGLVGNVVMGLVFGWWFRRTGRVMPMLVSHFIQDATVFIGYAALAPHWSWLR